MIEIKTVDDFDRFLDLVSKSENGAFLFKHSTQCPISGAAYEQFEKFLHTQDLAANHALVRVIESRSASDEIESRTGIQHESPQALLFKGGKVVWNASHRAINCDSLARALADN